VYGPRDNLFLPNLLEVAGTGRLRIFGAGYNRICFSHVDNYRCAHTHARTHARGRTRTRARTRALACILVRAREPATSEAGVSATRSACERASRLKA
jgi:nucleoside-diphosphate-sugar epimerase